MKHTWILLLFFSCQTKTTHVDTTSDTALLKDVVTEVEVSNATKPVLTPDIAGTYVMDESRDCDLQISIIKTGSDFTYELKTIKRNVKGKISLSRGEGSEEMYINLLDLPWDGYEGDVSKEKSNSKPGTKPQSLEMLYSDDALDIQNSGNAMNSYEKLAECGDKFIHLEKKK